MTFKWMARLDTIYNLDGHLVVNVGPFETKEQLILWCNKRPELKDAHVSIECLFMPE